MSYRLFTSGLLLVLAASSSPVMAVEDLSTAQDWNQWRGPARNGHAAVFGSPDWSQKPTVAWQIAVGSGQASPVLDGDHVLVFDRIEDNERLASYHVDSGDLLWQHSDPVKFKAGMGGGSYGGGPKATPIVSDGKVVTYGVTSLLTARESSSGKLLWRRDMKQEATDPVLYWGNSMSPIVVERQVIIQYGNDRNGGIRAYDLETGKERWRIEGEGSAYSSPILVQTEASIAIALMTWEGLLGLSPQGKTLWRAPLAMSMARQNTATPLFHRGHVVYVGESRPLHAARLEPGEGEWRLSPVWRRADLPHNMASPVAFDDRVCGVTTKNRGQLVCVSLESGEDLWRGPARGGDFAVLLVSAENLLALYPEGRLVVIERAADSYLPVAEHELGDGDSDVWAHPAVLPGSLILKTDQSLTRWLFAAKN